MDIDVQDHRIASAAMAAPYLSREQETELATRWRVQDDSDARDDIAMAHLRLVVSMAGKFRGFGLPKADLVQEGYVGLLEAAARFDHQRGVRFSTYASWWVRASMQDYVLRNWSIVRGGTSSTQKALFFKLRRLRAKIAARDRSMSSQAIYEEIAASLGVSVSDVQVMDARLSGNDASLQAPVGNDGEEGTERIDLLVCDAPLPEEQVSGIIDGERLHLRLKRALTKLTARENRVIRARKLADDSATLAELGAELGISKERVRQIENRALEKLKMAMTSENTGELAIA
ncbi:MAG: RNA polymerase factor sigma-32 [Martelella sp.]|uniref:RNA polymerase factor sigma-32 n=1 Tax=unclassified Martelella TaxID=2629616 RepID=UPI000C4ACBB3|nr:RNA polymerase factor sigma-32 [Martelella sp.]MAU20040.1 RNA polymerase factor sigma-32 [Martelella sp.]|tara:strand:- start:117 stop:980 length:864 start_codon:yes stop_codon:yes gene_type:complete